MISKAQAKYINSLRLKKNRQIHMQFIAEGVKIVNELLLSNFRIDSIYATEQWINQQTATGNQQSASYKLYEITEDELKRISNLETPNEVLAILNIPEFDLDISILSDELSLVLDNISDPGNLGTIIRISDWFGIKHIICSEECVDVYNPKVVQSTMGSIIRVMCHYTNLQDFLGTMVESVKNNPKFKDFKIYGALLNSESIYTKKLSDKGLIIIGNESKGISSEVVEFISDGITIPGYSLSNDINKAESLNASVATGIICAEFRRRGSLFH